MNLIPGHMAEHNERIILETMRGLGIEVTRKAYGKDRWVDFHYVGDDGREHVLVMDTFYGEHEE